MERWLNKARVIILLVVGVALIIYSLIDAMPAILTLGGAIIGVHPLVIASHG